MADDGRLGFAIGMTYDELIEAGEKAKEVFGQIGQAAVIEGKHIDDVFKELGNEIGANLSSLNAEVKFDVLDSAINNLKLQAKGLEQQIGETGAAMSDALANGDIKQYEQLAQTLVGLQEDYVDVTVKAQDYARVLDELGVATGNVVQRSQEAPMFFNFQSEYENVKKLKDEIEDLKGKIGNVMSSDQFDSDVVAMMGENLLDLEKKLDAAEAKARDAASALGGELGGKAAEVSTRLYELNDAILKQQDTIRDLNKELEDWKDKLKAAHDANSTDDIAAAELEISRLNEELRNANNGLANLQSRQKDTANEMSKLNGEISSQQGIMVKLMGGMDNYRQALSMLPAPLAGVVSGINGMTAASLRFIATPIGAVLMALVLAIKAVKTAFEGTVENQLRFAKYSGYLKGILGSLRDVVIKVGTAIIDMFTKPIETGKIFINFLKDAVFGYFKRAADMATSFAGIFSSIFKGDWEGAKNSAKEFGEAWARPFVGIKNAIEDAGEALVKFGKDMANDAKERSKIEYGRKQLEVEESQWQPQKTELETQKSEQEAIAIDTQKSAAERQAALAKILAIENQIYEKEKYFAEQRLNFAQREKALTKNNIQDYQELYDAQNKLAQVNRSRQQSITSLTSLKNGIINAAKEQDKAIYANDIKAKRELEQAEIDIMEEGHEKRLRQLKLNYEKELDAIKNEEDALREKQGGSLTKEQQKKFDDRRVASLSRFQYNEGRENLQNEVDVLNQQKAVLDMRLAAVKKESAEELQIRLDQIETERQIELASNKLLAQNKQQSEADINAKYNKQREDLLRGRVDAYKTAEQQMLDYTREFAEKRAALESLLNKEGVTEAEKKRIRGAIAVLENEYKHGFKELQQQLIDSSLGDVFVDATFANIEKALEKLTELEAIQSLEEFNARYGTQMDNAQWADFQKMLKQTRQEINNMSNKELPKLKDAFEKAFKGDSPQAMKEGVDYLVSGLNAASNAINNMANSMKRFAEITGNVELSQFADTVGRIGAVINEAGSAASAASSSGNGWVVLAAAIVGTGLGIAEQITDRQAEIAQAAAQQRERQQQYLQDMNEALLNLSSSTDNIVSVLSQMNYGEYRKALLDGIHSLQDATQGTGDEFWNAIYNNPSWDRLRDFYHFSDENLDTIVNSLSYMLTDIPEKYKEYRERYYSEHGTYSGIISESDWKDEYINGLSREEKEELYRNYRGDLKEILNKLYANEATWNNVMLNQRRDALVARMQDLYTSGSLDSLQYFNLANQADALTLEMLKNRQEQARMTGGGTIVDDLQKEIDELVLKMNERAQDIFAGFAGIDLQGIVNKWLGIFQKFGDDLDGAFKEIEDSIKDMLRNLVYQTTFVQPMMENLQNIIAQHKTGDYTYDDIEGMINDVYGEVEIAGQAWSDVVEKLKEKGLWPIDETTRAASQKGIATASQDSVDELNGRMTAVQGHTYDIREYTILIHNIVADMNSSVAMIRDYTSHLVRMDEDLRAVRNSLSGIEMQGVSLR